MFQNAFAFTGSSTIEYHENYASEKKQKLKAFSALSVAGPFEVELIFSNKSELIIEDEKEAINSTLVLSKGKELAITYKGKEQPNKLIKLSVYTTSMREIALSGKAELYGPETLQGRSITITVEEHASCYLDLNFENIKCELTGAGQAEFTGACKQVTIETEDAAFLECDELKAERLILKARGASNSKVFASNYLKVTASNAANIVYSGKPKQEDFKTEGSVRLEAYPE